jgi:hypothetical protein
MNQLFHKCSRNLKNHIDRNKSLKTVIENYRKPVKVFPRVCLHFLQRALSTILCIRPATDCYGLIVHIGFSLMFEKFEQKFPRYEGGVVISLISIRHAEDFKLSRKNRPVTAAPCHLLYKGLKYRSRVRSIESKVRRHFEKQNIFRTEK